MGWIGRQNTKEGTVILLELMVKADTMKDSNIE